MNRKVVLNLALLVLLPACGSSESPARPPTIQYEEIGTQGMTHFVFAGGLSKADRSTYRQISDYICRETQVCIVMFWDNRAHTPRSLPMTDEQVNSKVAHYNLNKSTGMDRLLICAEGGC